MKQVTRYMSDGITPAPSSFDEGTVKDGAATTPRRLWWKNTSTASEVLEACQMRRLVMGGSDGLLYLQIAADVPKTPPAAPTLAVAAGSELGEGLYKYAITFVNANGETSAGAEEEITTASPNQRVQLTAIAIGPAGTTARRIYRTAVDGSQKKLVIIIGDNTTTEYLDQIPDESLGANIPTLNTSGSAGSWGTDPLPIGDMVVGDYAACWMRFNVPAGITQTGNPRQVYVRFEEA